MLITGCETPAGRAFESHRAHQILMDLTPPRGLHRNVFARDSWKAVVQFPLTKVDYR